MMQTFGCATCGEKTFAPSAVLCETHEMQVLGITREMLDANDGDDVLLNTRQLWDQWTNENPWSNTFNVERG
jgi:hypothetical protein